MQLFNRIKVCANSWISCTLVQHKFNLLVTLLRVRVLAYLEGQRIAVGTSSLPWQRIIFFEFICIKDEYGYHLRPFVLTDASN